MTIRFRSRSLLWLALLVCFLLVGSLIGCGGGGSIIPSLSGVQGQATKGPTSPTVQPGQSNYVPLPGVVIVARHMNGSEVERQTTDSQGNFKIGLAPGTYQVEGLAPNASIPPYSQGPQTVTVTANQYLTVNVSYDTGVR